MEKRYTVRQAVTLTGVKSYVLRYWEEELELRIGRNELGHRYYTPFDIQLFLKINELKSKGLQLKAIRTLIPPEVRKTDTPDFSESDIRILEGEAVELEDTPMKNTGSEKEFMEKAESGNTEKCGADNDKILEFQEIMERLIREEMQRKKEGEYRCRSLDEAIRRQQQARREAAASCEGKKNKRNRKAAGKPAASFIIAAYQADGALLSRDSTNWTGLSACSAVNTSVCVDYIMLVSLRNSLVRALTLTCSTANAFVRNYICHN